MDRLTVRAATALLAVVGTLALAGCGTTEPATTAAGDDETQTATRFVACLTTHGIDARIGDDGLVLVVADGSGGTTGAGGGAPSGSQPLRLLMGDDGRFWVAAQDSGYFARDPLTQQAYEDCEQQEPGFRQPTDVADAPVLTQGDEGHQEAELAFARCARDAGFAWVADPAPDGGIPLPVDITEDEFRALLTACYAADTPWISWRFDGELGFDYSAVMQDYLGPAGELGTAGPLGGTQDGSR